MSSVEQLLEASRQLRPDERLTLAEALWELVAADDDAGELQLSAEQRAEMDRRWERFQAHPESAVSWEDGLAKLAELRDRR